MTAVAVASLPSICALAVGEASVLMLATVSFLIIAVEQTVYPPVLGALVSRSSVDPCFHASVLAVSGF